MLDEYGRTRRAGRGARIISTGVCFLTLLTCLNSCSQVSLPGNQVLPAGQPTEPAGLFLPELVDALPVTQAYLDSWKAEDYVTMYGLLTSVSQDALALEEFEGHYRSVAAEAALEGVDYEILSLLVNSDSAQASYRVRLRSILVGEISRDTVMNLRLEGGRWRVEWDDSLLLPELKGGNYLLMDRLGYTPSRANIYDREGRALVAQTDATALGLYPDQIDPAQREQMLAQLAELTGVRVDALTQMLAVAPSGADWYLPVGEVSADRLASRYDLLSTFKGLVMQPYKARYYFEGGIAPHLLGYVGAIQPEEVDALQRQGYSLDDRIGRSGLEKWGEKYLAGSRGGALYVFNAQGKPVTRLAETLARPSQSIFTTLDRNLQVGAQQAMSGFPGAIVALERDTGRVLAMVSTPGFDPNAFEPINFNSSRLLSEILSNPDRPLLNRATQGAYPLGSVFKIITMAAGLQSGFYTPETLYQCGYLFEELPGVALHDWTYDYYLRDGRTIPSGLLTLSQGLMRSCNPFFWHIGLDLYQRGQTSAVAEMARGFGLGKPTGIAGVEEIAGNIPDPVNAVDAVNMAIGQGDILVTPLQVAVFSAAIGNGGTLYEPQVIERISPPDGQPTYVFQPKEAGKLPLSPESLQAIQAAMVGVIRNEQPRGTAWHRFTGLDVNVAGKTGTAQSGGERPHAWFAGYTFAGREDKPDIAIAVVVENRGEGSDYAAPIFRRIVELYFSGQPLKLYWWEAGLNIPFTPTPIPPATPLPGADLTPTP